MFLLLAIFMLLVLPSPWDVVGFAAGLVLGVGEVLFWQRRVRSLRPRAGAETLIGQRARVVSDCRPVGRVSVAGALWEARCVSGAAVGETVRVVARERLVLVVEPAPQDD